jgi:hypothetical protein
MVNLGSHPDDSIIGPTPSKRGRFLFIAGKNPPDQFIGFFK